MLGNVKIEQDKDNPMIHRVYKDGKEIKRLVEVNLNISANLFPEVDITICGGCDFEGMADIHFDYSPHTVKEACKILQEELLKHGDLYRAFTASIHSALKDMPDGTWIDEMPEIILSRIIGEN